MKLKKSFGIVIVVWSVIKKHEEEKEYYEGETHMPFCPKCDKENPVEASYCFACGSQLYVAPNPSYQAIQYSTAQYTAAKFRFDSTPYVFVGTICALISIFFVPLLFGIIAIICGGTVLRKAIQSSQRQQGWFVIALGVLCMVIGLILGMLAVLPYM